MENNTIKKAILYRKNNEIIITEEYPEGNVKGEFVIFSTPLGYQLRVYDDSWKMLDRSMNLIKLLSVLNMDYMPIEVLASHIQGIGYKLEII